MKFPKRIGVLVVNQLQKNLKMYLHPSSVPTNYRGLPMNELLPVNSPLTFAPKKDLN
jgi:hypothetical protein